MEVLSERFLPLLSIYFPETRIDNPTRDTRPGQQLERFSKDESFFIIIGYGLKLKLMSAKTNPKC